MGQPRWCSSRNWRRRITEGDGRDFIRRRLLQSSVTPEEFTEQIEERNRTALSRLGSSKAVYAETAGEMDAQRVLQAAADAEYHAETTYRTWAAETENPEVASIWETTADEEAEHYDRVVAELNSDHDPGPVPAVQVAMREEATTVRRAGAFLGRTLAADRSKSQFTGFFVGQAEPALASLFRELGDDLNGQIERIHGVLVDVCTDEIEWSEAGDAADGAIQAAYEEYTNTLEDMGVDPKPVC